MRRDGEVKRRVGRMVVKWCDWVRVDPSYTCVSISTVESRLYEHLCSANTWILRFN